VRGLASHRPASRTAPKSSPMFQIDYNAAAKIKEFHRIKKKRISEKHQNG